MIWYGRPGSTICTYEDEICEDEGCEVLSALPRATLVHEMAHVWSNQNLDEATREQFLEVRGLEDWDGTGLAWAERGSEHAAEVIMRGVMDETLDLFRLGRPSCEELEEAYQGLTGLPSLHFVLDVEDKRPERAAGRWFNWIEAGPRGWGGGRSGGKLACNQGAPRRRGPRQNPASVASRPSRRYR